jgi:membrane protease YdiL (CAAX protease family)
MAPRLLPLLPYLWAFLSAWAATTLLALGLQVAGSPEPARTARKLLVPCVIGLVLLYRRTGVRDAPKLFAWPARTGLPEIPRGFLIGAGSLLLLNLVLMAFGFRAWAPEGSWPKLVPKFLGYLGGALVLALLEESFFRGALHEDLGRAVGPRPALFLGALVFGVAHFLRPPRGHDPDAEPARVALDCLLGVGEAFGPRWRELAGLVLVGWVLGLLRVLQGHIGLALGVHAGWVFIRQAADKLLAENDPLVDRHLLLVGTMRHYDGILGWAVLLGSGLLAALLVKGAPGSGAAPRGARGGA